MGPRLARPPSLTFSPPVIMAHPHFFSDGLPAMPAYTPPTHIHLPPHCTALTMAEPDDLYTLRQEFYVGNFQV